MNPASAAYKLAFDYSPIYFTGGVLSSISPLFGSIGLPIIAVTEALSVAGNTARGILSGANITLPEQPFFTWRPMPGGTLWKSEISEFPFYTNQIAANSQIQQPLNISMLGHCPASNSAPFTIKLATMEALQAFIQTHVNNGGTFTVATPGYIYTDCLLTQMVDVSAGETNQSQVSWQLDFTQPLLTFGGNGNPISGALSSGLSAISSGGVF